MTITELVLLAGACWMLSYMLVVTQGPAGIFERLRNWRGGRWHGRMTYSIANGDRRVDYHGLLDCQVCFSFWVGQGLALVTHHTVIEGLAVAGIAMLLHSWSGWRFGQ